MDKYSQRNCRRKGLTLLKVSGRRILEKRQGDVYWKMRKICLTHQDSYRECLTLCRLDGRFVKL